MVIGIVAKNGILLLDANEKFLAAGFSAEDAIIQAGRRRLRPIVITALATAVIDGVLVSMVLSLVITPAIQFLLDRRVRLAPDSPGGLK